MWDFPKPHKKKRDNLSKLFIMKNLIIIFLAGFFIIGCQPEKLESNYLLKEDSPLKIGIKEQFLLGNTDQIEVLEFTTEEKEADQISERSYEPIKYDLEYAATPDPAGDCCGAQFLGFDEYDLSEPFLLFLQEYGFGYEFYDEEWNHWIIDKMNANGTVDYNVLDNFYTPYSANHDVDCDDTTSSYGTGLWYPSGSIAPGYYRIYVERGYTDGNNSGVLCTSAFGYAWYGNPTF
ncbi:hypothetical protein IX84_31830 [Phaeodactylibacter xiamenensis]|uniref:Uncharacterized protein n=2 Tax=Phaeodactylibacter xiamenensis TaxID=1524460 RepID=A0A098RY49_9BACT|nr:hypothetical protein IX84_31830 [Phaeodactylibacter xiamenensis]